MQENTIQLHINGQSITVPAGTNVYQAARLAGASLPIFCYQDRMPPLGACRVCLVEVEGMHKLQTSCTLMAQEGMRVWTESEGAVQGRKGILEFLLINHPLDCPVCDKGGECPLQDHTIRYGPGFSAFFEKKRRAPKAQPITPILMLDQERCILCARCTRFGELIAGDHALEILERGDRSCIGRQKESRDNPKFLGNTIAICPVGALTSRVYRFRARPWDNASHTTVCPLCPVGCRLVLDERDGEIVRTRAGEEPAVNDMWLCDKGWFGYEHLASQERIQEPWIKRGGKFHPISWEDAFAVAARELKKATLTKKIAGWGGSPLTVEENYLFQKLLREGCGASHLEHRFGESRFSAEEDGLPPGMDPALGGSLADLEQLDWGWVFGVEMTEEFPLLWLRLHAALQKGARLSFFGHIAPERRTSFYKEQLHAPGEELAVAQEAMRQPLPQGRGALFVGGSYLFSLHRRAILAEFLSWCRRHQVALHLLEGKNNSFGARLAGMLPDRGPLGASLSTLGKRVEEILESSSRESWDVLYVAGVDLSRHFPARLLQEARKNLGFLLVQELFWTKTALAADLVLPVAGFAEKEGTFCNIAGLTSAWKKGKNPPPGCRSDGEIFRRLGEELGISMEVDPAWAACLQRRKTRFPVRPNEIEAPLPNLAAIKKEPGLLLSVVPCLFGHGSRMQHNSHLFAMAAKPSFFLHAEEARTLGLHSGDLCLLRRKESVIKAEAEISDRVPRGVVVVAKNGPLPIQEWGEIVVGQTAVEVEKA